MSDSSTTIVPIISNYPDRERKANQIINWLISSKAIKPIKTDCILSSDFGYSIDIGAKELTDEPKYLPFDLITNGLQVTTIRSIFDTGENGLDSFVCPNCSNDILSEEWNFTIYHETGDSQMNCPLCQKSSDLNDYVIEPTWGFSNIGFTFWNWPMLNKKTILNFEEILECKVKIVESHI